MTRKKQNSVVKDKSISVNPEYAAFQIAQAFTTSEEHDDPLTRKRAKEKIIKWETVLKNILSDSVKYGSRVPVTEIPAWATLEVITGGFATGNLLAAGPLQDYEKILLAHLAKISKVKKGEERLALNTYFLTDIGLAQLQRWIETGCYDILVPEESALLVIAWLIQNRYGDDARQLLDKISPYFSKLRFYPIPQEHPQQFGPQVHLQNTGSILESLRHLKPNKRILTQKEAMEIWLPFYDRTVSLFLETVKNGWPCQCYPEGWSERALILLHEYKELRGKHTLCRKIEKTNEHSAQLRKLLDKCVKNSDKLTGKEIGRIRLILNCYIEKRGEPDSSTCKKARRCQANAVNAPTFHAIAQVVVARLENYPKDEGINDISFLQQAVTKEEAIRSSVSEGTSIPHSIWRKVERCLNETVHVLVKRGIITSSETLAGLLPQMTSEIRAAGIKDPLLRQLYSAVYCAFRQRRSLLLLNLEKQVQLEELPWVKAMEQFRNNNLSDSELARQTLEELVVLVLTSFPHVILPNKLLQELRSLIQNAELNILLVDELAADIFMGQFSEKFVESVRRAASLLRGSLYEKYYGINYGEIEQTLKKETQKCYWPWQKKKNVSDKLAHICASRAGVSLDVWNTTVANGMLIEQQQILTTQNLAALFVGLDLVTALQGQLGEMTKQCFKWICRRQQIKATKWHDYAIMLKNTAYAWRQMIFFLSFLSKNEIFDFLRWAEGHLNEQEKDFNSRFCPVLEGLQRAVETRSFDSYAGNKLNSLRFLGWSKERHWLTPYLQNR